MLIMGFNGAEVHEKSQVIQWLTQDGLGGVILFDKDLSTGQYGKNLKNQAQIKQLIQQLQTYAKINSPLEQNQNTLLVALDYEGGAVDRLTKIEGCMPTMSPEKQANLLPSDFDEEISLMASTLKSLGFNLNFAPVVDLNLNNQLGIIGKLERSFSSDPERVAQCAQRFVELFTRHGVACCYKHFPGHGSAIGDTHEGFVDVTQSFNKDELLPYRLLFKNQEQPVMVMTAHVVNKNLDAKGLPATLSYDILTGLLRNTLNFDGVIISDDLQMQAIAKHYSLEESLELTVNAGADMLIFGNQLGSISAKEVIDCIENLVIEGKISQQRIDDAYRHVVRFKQQIGSWAGDMEYSSGLFSPF